MTPLPWWGDLIVGAAAVLVALGTISRYIWPALRGAWRLVQGVARLVEDYRDTGGFGGLAAQNDKLTEKVEGITRELHPNGGSSMRDSVTRTERALTDLRAQVRAVDEKAQALGERQEVLRRTDQQYAADLKHYIEKNYAEAIEANAALRAALNEVLAIPDDEGGPDGRAADR